MKYILIAFLIILSVHSNACMCVPPKFTEKYTESDFIAKVKIIKVYKNESEAELYKADILIEDLYKGSSISSIYVRGRSDEKKGSSCAIFIPENTELIIYARNFNNGKFAFGSCSGYVYLNQDKRTLRSEIREIEMLNVLKARKVDYSADVIYYPKNGDFFDQLTQFKGLDLNKSFTLYELTFAADVTLKSVSVISGFDKKTDSALIEMIEKSDWKAIRGNAKIDQVPENSRFLIGFYYYKEEGKYQSFISDYDL